MVFDYYYFKIKKIKTTKTEKMYGHISQVHTHTHIYIITYSKSGLASFVTGLRQK
jgi:hypothetical protein